MTDKPIINAKDERIHVSYAQAGACLRQAAELLSTVPYTPFPEYEDNKGGASLGMALCRATRCGKTADRAYSEHSIVCDEIRRRFVGYLYMTGDLISAPHVSVPDEIEWWERNPPYTNGQRVLAALRASAVILENHLDEFAMTVRTAPQ